MGNDGGGVSGAGTDHANSDRPSDYFKPVAYAAWVNHECNQPSGGCCQSAQTYRERDPIGHPVKSPQRTNRPPA